MKFCKWLLIVIYIGFIVSQTLMGRAVHPEPIFRTIFWELQNGMWHDMFLNILLFVPLGFLVGGWKGILVCFVISCGIETVQYFTRIGFCELDDVLNNTIGAVVGIFIKLAFNRINNLRKEI